MCQTISQHLCIRFFRNFWKLPNFPLLLSKNRFKKHSAHFLFFIQYCDHHKDASLQKDGTITGFPWDSRKRARLTNVCAIDREISTDYNGELSASCGAFFLMINSPCIAEQRITNTKVMMVHGKKNVSGLSMLYYMPVKLVGNLRNVTGE